MRFFSKIALILNICFLVSMYFYYKKMYISNTPFLRPLGSIAGSVVVLGEIAWILNAFFLLILFIRAAFKMKNGVAKWIIGFNLLVFAVQVYFYFFDRS